MKFFAHLSLCILALSCSSFKTPQVDPNLYLKLNEQHRPKHLACIAHRDKLVTKAITESEDAELDDEHYFFVRNEKTALSFINKFDLTKFTLVENQMEYQAIMQGCVVETKKTHLTCDTIFPTYKFFRGLVYGLRQYPWSDETKRKATQLTLNYLDYVARSNSSLMDILFANDLLRRLAEHAYINPELYKDTWDFKTLGEQKYELLKENVRKLGNKKLTCKDANGFYSDEREKVKELSVQFLKLLNKAEVFKSE